MVPLVNGCQPSNSRQEVDTSGGDASSGLTADGDISATSTGPALVEGCTSHLDCTENVDRPACDPVSQSCVACTTDNIDACASEASICLMGECGPCNAAPDPDDACADAAVARGNEAVLCDTASGRCIECSVEHPEICGSAEVCDTEAGRCVPCASNENSVCSGATPICNMQSQTCQPCQFHRECVSLIGSGCNLMTGACLPGPDDASNVVFHVKDEFVEGADGSEDFPFSQIKKALDVAGPEVTIFLHEDGDGPIGDDFSQVVTIDGVRVVALIAGEGEKPTWTESLIPDSVPLSVGDGAAVFLEGLHLSGIRVVGPGSVLHIDDTYVVDHANGEVVASYGATVYVRNSIIGDHLGGTALSVVGSNVWLTYATVVSPSMALLCDGAELGSIRNSLLLSSSGELDCPELQLLHSVVEPAGEAEQDWFRDWNAGDFRLGDGILPDALGITVWQTDATLPDPPFDIEGDPRPTEEGVDYVGADVP